MKRLIKIILVIAIVVGVLALIPIFAGAHFCLGNTQICFTSEG
jgi:hypothetical protein